MKSETSGVLFSHLTAQGFLFNEGKNRDLSKFIEPFAILIQMLPIKKISNIYIYRARTIDKAEDINTGKGISIENGNIVGGFDEDNSRISPAECCKLQRLNRAREQVFYIAEERDTAIKEQKVKDGDMLSIAKFKIVSPVNILDFAAYTHEELHEIVTDEIEQEFQRITNHSARQLYVEVQKFLTILDSTEDFYKVSNKICDLMKKDVRMDGIRYYSYYSGHNLGIWKYRHDDYMFCGSEIQHVKK